MVRILVVGQTPPPYGGQAIMIERMLKHRYANAELFHVRMEFSNEIDEIGKFHWSKIGKLVRLILRIYHARFKYKTNVLYYPPAGPDFIPIFRDILILNSTRWLFKKTIFHFHAGGVSEFYRDLNPFLKFLYRKSYYYPEVSIASSELNPPDGIFFRSKKNIVIPLGIPVENYPTKKIAGDSVPTVLFVGVLKESKGVLILLHACASLKVKKIPFMVCFVGHFNSEDCRNKVYRLIEDLDLTDIVSFLGVLTGKAKNDVFLSSDIFCFPSFFESETFGMVILEAMQAGLPVVSTKWRGIPSIVQNDLNGYLVPIKNPDELASKLQYLIQNKEERKRLGDVGRKIFFEKYSIDKFYSNMDNLFKEINSQS